MKICSTCSIQGTDDCDLIYDIYLSDGDSELMLTVCHLCHAMIKSHLPSANESSSYV